MRVLRSLMIVVALVAACAGDATAQVGHSPFQDPPGTPTSGIADWAAAEVPLPDIDGEAYMISPDGTRIAGAGLDEDLCVWEITSGEPTCTQAKSFFGDRGTPMAWSPDGTAIAFVATPFTESDITVWEIETGVMLRVTDDGISDRGDPTNTPIPTDYAPTWSTDSQWITFLRDVSNVESPSTNVITISRDGSESIAIAARITDVPHQVAGRVVPLADDSIVYAIAGYSDTPVAEIDGVWRIPVDGEPEQLDLGMAEGLPQRPRLLDAALVDDEVVVVLTEQTGWDVGTPTWAIRTGDDPQVLASLPATNDPTDHAALLRLSPDGQSAITYVWDGNVQSVCIMNLSTAECSTPFGSTPAVTDVILGWYDIFWVEGDRIFLNPIEGLTSGQPRVFDLAPRT